MLLLKMEGKHKVMLSRLNERQLDFEGQDIQGYSKGDTYLSISSYIGTLFSIQLVSLHIVIGYTSVGRKIEMNAQVYLL